MDIVRNARFPHFVNLGIIIIFIFISIKESKTQPTKAPFANTKQPIRSREILRPNNERTLIGRNPAVIYKREDE